jgi:hypothetical protein
MIGDARLRPLFECGDECLLREVFGEADVAGEAGEAGDDARGLDAPYGFDGAMEDLMWIGSGHCYRSHQLQSVYASPAIFRWSDSGAQRGGVLCAGSALRTGWGRILPSQRPGGFRFRSRRRGERLTHSMASSRDLTCKIQKPATSSLVSVKGTVDDGTRLAGEFDTCAFGAGMEAIEGEQDASLDELFVELAHVGHELRIGEGAFFF